MLAVIPKAVIIAMTEMPTGQLAIDAATRRSSKLFVAYIALLVVSALLIALFTWLTWDAGNRVQDAVISDANAIFKNSGWQDATERFATGGTGNGFFIAVRDRMNAPTHAVSIQKAYKLIGIDMNGFSKPDVPEGRVQIFIGHKTPVQ